ncbi:DHH family phosphoesterase [Thermoactinomyces sp. DSM 45892]|uniref:single-stranded-DNA-specific exonuclease RecJ n=1 Tax=Thermoactinomyces sp. DSM 45892 TaxID=1882753 RepID=UPI000897899D|nr:DHH family phosphoesterase [Thermoactinomyces sp. DSM 45892]SDX93702.1 single-stranded-DNA-specific exonuclease [Thermoactinomyces sp. DSM 45892]
MDWVQRRPEKSFRKHDSVYDKIAKVRGIKDMDRFLNPTIQELYDPYLMKNIEEASNRIIKAIGKNERICLSFDPDADGITATSTMLRYLNNYSNNLYYTYSERSKGHGIENQINQIEEETDLLIIIDSSSNDVEICKEIREEQGVDIIILDHHSIERLNPYATIVNPQQEGCEYPNTHLSGAGVVFKVIQVMEDTLGQVDPYQFLDLVAIGMYADVMKVDVLENRFIIQYGLQNIQNTGIKQLLKGANINIDKMNASVIGFTIAPLLNGVARMDKIKLAIDLLLEDDDRVCHKILQEMKSINEKRKKRQKEIANRYMKHLDDKQKVMIVIDEQASKGFNGLIAQQIAQTFQRPAIVGSAIDGVISGSFRTYNGFPFKTFLQGFGNIEAVGHESAGGLFLKEERLQDFGRYIDWHIPQINEPSLMYDLEINITEIPNYIDEIERINRITGNGFPKISVKVNGIVVDKRVVIGKMKDTIKIDTLDDCELIKFRTDGEYGSELSCFDEVAVVGELRWNEWFHFGLRKKIVVPQIMIDDYSLA